MSSKKSDKDRIAEIQQSLQQQEEVAQKKEGQMENHLEALEEYFGTRDLDEIDKKLTEEEKELEKQESQLSEEIDKIEQELEEDDEEEEEEEEEDE